MTNSPLRSKDLIIISALESFVAKEVNLIKILLLQKFKAIRLVPSSGENIERDLSTNTKGQVEISKLLLHRFHHVFANVSLEINFFIVVAFFAGAVASNWRYVHHTAAEFDEGPSLDWNINISKVLQRPIHDSLDVVLSQKFGNGLNFLKFSIFVGHKPILTEIVRKNLGNALTKLLLLFGQIGSPHDADCDFLGELLHESHHVGGDFTTRDGECAINVKEGDDSRVDRCFGHLLLFCWVCVRHFCR
mmetsp:Transcript_17490/g.36697  ORF Transcript_17490/g.36697 Transcript_17490/m.36697 type:complete len:247 (+) Transcript_17490:275-1015(+)